MPVYDHPFYKRLAKNDLGQDTHQGGPAIPKDLRPFLPPLPPPKDGPTEEYFIRLELFDGGTPLGIVTARWHYQTWKKTRVPETRLTQNIVPRLLKTAAEGDYLVFERRIDAIDLYRVRLLRGGTKAHAEIRPANPRRAWGPLTGNVPVSLAPLAGYTREIEQGTVGEFIPFIEPRAETLHQRLLRDTAFSRLVKRAYDNKCCVCTSGLIMPVDNADHEPPSEPEAAHIIPVSQGGPDDVRNALCLCRRHHWAFDRGLIFVSGDLTWGVSGRALKEPRNHQLQEDNGIHMTVPLGTTLRPSPVALEWHREKVALA